MLMAYDSISSFVQQCWNAPSNFTYIPGETPFSSWKVPLIASTSYLLGVFLLQKFMKGRNRISATFIGTIHNLIMFTLSVVCFFGILYGALKEWSEHGLEVLYCDSQRKTGSKGTLYFWLYVFYLSKFYEYIDTILILVRKSDLIFLHVYHHWITGPLCFVCLNYAIPVQWSATSFNALVHIPMYWYYLLTVFNIRPWWKKYITQFQIVQFIIGIAIHTSAVVYHYQFSKECRSYDGYGNQFAGLIMWSYLFLFIDLYRRSYTSRPAQREKKEQ